MIVESVPFISGEMGYETCAKSELLEGVRYLTFKSSRNIALLIPAFPVVPLLLKRIEKSQNNPLSKV